VDNLGILTKDGKMFKDTVDMAGEKISRTIA